MNKSIFVMALTLPYNFVIYNEILFTILFSQLEFNISNWENMHLDQLKQKSKRIRTAITFIN